MPLPTKKTVALFASAAACLASGVQHLQAQTTGDGVYAQTDDWIEPGARIVLDEYSTWHNANGLSGLLLSEGAVNTEGHPFFQPIGTNGRACVTCHQPADGMSLSAQSVRERWDATGGTDPLFAAVDGSNCPTLPQGERDSHSLLLDYGLFRIGMPWPPKAPDGSRIEPEFTLNVVSDPTTCNNDPEYGLESAEPTVSVFRRPRPVANANFFAYSRGRFSTKDGMPFPVDPETGLPVAYNIMSDSRAPSLAAQAADAAHDHMQLMGSLTPEQIQQIEQFERQVYLTQVFDNRGGALSDGQGLGGPESMQRGRGFVAPTDYAPIFPEIAAWVTHDAIGEPTWDRVFANRRVMPNWNGRPGQAAESPEQRAFRDSVARGYDLFQNRAFLIRDVANFNDVLGLGNPLKNSCLDCHNVAHAGNDGAPGWMDIGTNEGMATGFYPHLPLFRIVCSADAAPHAYLGREILTQDPGRALVTGRCRDVGSVTMQQFRGLAARAPYFVNGSAATLGDVIDYYDQRFDIGYTEQERADLINFLGAL